MALQILTLNYLLGKFQDVSMIERVLPKHSLRPSSITEFKRLLSLASHLQMKTCPCGKRVAQLRSVFVAVQNSISAETVVFRQKYTNFARSYVFVI